MAIKCHSQSGMLRVRAVAMQQTGFALAALLALMLLNSQPALAQTADQVQFDLHLADRRLPDARLTDISPAGGFEFKCAGDSKTYSMKEIVRWGKVRASVGAGLVWLGDGSWLAGQIHWKSEQAFELASDWFESIEIRLDEVRGIVFQPPISSREFADLERRMRSVAGAADVVWNGRSEQLSGLLALKLRQPIDEVMPAVPIWEMKPSGATERVMLDNANLQAIVFSPVLRLPIRASLGAMQIDLRDGSRLNVVSLDRDAAGRITVALGDGRKLEAVDMSPQFTSAITRIAGQPERVIWLSELEPARYRFMQEESRLSWPLGRNRDLFGKALFIDNDPVSHAVVLHAPAQVAYRWDGRKAKFLAEVSATAPASDLATVVGSVQCRVLVARDGQLVELFQSPTLRPGTPAVAIEVDISDAQLVVMLADPADQGSIGDHVLWRDARLVPLETKP